jgi:hypothetical protein
MKKLVIAIVTAVLVVVFTVVIILVAKGTRDAGVALAKPVIASEKFQKEGDNYTISITYPQVVSGVDDETKSRFNTEIEDYVTSSAASLRGQASAAEAQEFGLNYSLELDYAVQLLSVDKISVVLSGSEYTGGAHPSYVVQTFNFDVGNNVFLNFNDLFLPASNYLQTISNKAIAELSTRNISDENWLAEGAGPAGTNFEFFYLTSDSLVIIFLPYQVAPYAMGEQEVEIPYTELAGLLRITLP